MVQTKGTTNYGIIMSGGSLQATNLAVGERAQIILGGIEELRALISTLPPMKEAQAARGVAELEAAAAKPETVSPARVKQALGEIEGAAKSGAGTLEAAEKIISIAGRLAAFIL